MTKNQQQTQPKPLDLDQITQPFDLATALTYMRDNGEFVRTVIDGQDAYLYLEQKTVPVFVGGRRRFKTIETVSSVARWGGAVLTLPLAALTGDNYRIMLFDEIGEPIWDEPVVETSEEVG